MRGCAYATLNYDEYNFFFIIKKGSFFLIERFTIWPHPNIFLKNSHKQIRIVNNMNNDCQNSPKVRGLCDEKKPKRIQNIFIFIN